MSGAAQPQAGTRFERRCLDLLREAGYWAIRSPASKSPIDIIAICPGRVLFVQCKVNGRLDPGPWNDLYELSRTYGARPVLVERDQTGRVVTWWELMAAKPPEGARGTRGARLRFLIRESDSNG